MSRIYHTNSLTSCEEPIQKCQTTRVQNPYQQLFRGWTVVVEVKLFGHSSRAYRRRRKWISQSRNWWWIGKCEWRTCHGFEFLWICNVLVWRNQQQLLALCSVLCGARSCNWTKVFEFGQCHVDKSNGVENRSISALLYLVSFMKRKNILLLILALCKSSVTTIFQLVFLLRFLFLIFSFIFSLSLFFIYLKFLMGCKIIISINNYCTSLSLIKIN